MNDPRNYKDIEDIKVQIVHVYGWLGAISVTKVL